MQKFSCLLGLFFVLSSGYLAAEEPSVSPSKEVKKEKGFFEKLDENMDSSFKPVSEFVDDTVFYSIPVAQDGDGNDIKMPWVLAWLGIAAVVITVYFKFLNFRSWRLAFRTVRGRYSKTTDPGEISHFQALSAAVSGTVGLGNIAGVAVAVSLGGPGATFWMILMGLFGMASKFCECTLGVKYRTIENGKVYGGPMQYLTKGLGGMGLKPLGVILAAFFALMCIGGSFGGGNMYQANQACSQLVAVSGGDSSFFGENRWIFGVIMAIIVGLVILGGIKSIATTTAAIVPFMCGIYMAAGLIVILTNIGQLGEAFGLIFKGAFDPTAVGGGIVGVLIQGIKRAAFSNEAGIGSAPIAHAAVKTKYAASEGIVALLEPFLDTVLVCTTTALVIVMAGTYNEPGLEGVEVTSKAFEMSISWFPYILAVAVILFAFSTMVSWSYYGLQAWTHLFGRSKQAEITYKLIFCGFIVLGSAVSAKSVINFSDGMIFAMSIPNVIAMYLLMPKVKEEYLRFIDHTKRVDSE
ncbi:MAG: alanine/glycine:cation symporter family protein [Akkermansiaceae bacterium]|jgi:AGCS family alanine or glycine:cation symporter|tara:strand:- start:4079 stop:5644 length:1566 start_codon:yes stop_codon:yes gene_type:complete